MSDAKPGSPGSDSSFGESGLTARGGFGDREDAHEPGGFSPRRFFAPDADVQVFPVSGEWVKPERPMTVDVLLCGAGDGGAGSDGVKPGASGRNGELVMRTFAAGDLPDRVWVEVGKGGRGGDGRLRGGDGADGLVVVTTHVAPA